MPKENPMPEQVQASEPKTMIPMFLIGFHSEQKAHALAAAIGACVLNHEVNANTRSVHQTVTIPASPTPSARPEQPKACEEIGEDWLPPGMKPPETRQHSDTVRRRDYEWRTYIRSRPHAGCFCPHCNPDPPLTKPKPFVCPKCHEEVPRGGLGGFGHRCPDPDFNPQPQSVNTPGETSSKGEPMGDKELDAAEVDVIRARWSSYLNRRDVCIAGPFDHEIRKVLTALDSLRKERDEAVRMQAELRIKLSVCEGERDDERSRHALALLAARTEHVLKCPICTGDSVRLKEENDSLRRELEAERNQHGTTLRHADHMEKSGREERDDLRAERDEAVKSAKANAAEADELARSNNAITAKLAELEKAQVPKIPTCGTRFHITNDAGDIVCARCEYPIHQHVGLMCCGKPIAAKVYSASPPAPQEPKPCVTCGVCGWEGPREEMHICNPVPKPCERCGHFRRCHHHADHHVELGCNVKARCCMEYIPPPASSPSPEKMCPCGHARSRHDHSAFHGGMICLDCGCGRTSPKPTGEEKRVRWFRDVKKPSNVWRFDADNYGRFSAVGPSGIVGEYGGQPSVYGITAMRAENGFEEFFPDAPQSSPEQRTKEQVQP